MTTPIKDTCARVALIAFASVLSFLALTPLARANYVTFDFSGSVYAVDSSISGRFRIGQFVKGFYTFDSSTPGQPYAPGGVVQPGSTLYLNPLVAFQARVGSYRIGLGGENEIFVFNNPGIQDRYVVQLNAPSGKNFAGLPVSDFVLNFQDNSGTTISSGSLPLSPATLTQFPSAAGVLDFVSGINPQDRVTFSIDSVTEPVPEPPALALVGVCLLCWLGFSLAYKRVVRI